MSNDKRTMYDVLRPAFITLSFGVLSALAAVWLLDITGGVRAAVFTAGIPVFVLYTMLIAYIVQRNIAVRDLNFRIALTGRPQAGKTVFSVLLFDSLLNERIAGLSFTAESRSVISVYQAIRNLPADTWPRSTSPGVVSTYQGTIGTRTNSIALEVGDSAGEHWIDLSSIETRDPGYLEYVLSADAIAHVIPLDSLQSGADIDDLARDVQDLKLVARLKRQIKDSSSKRIPLIIVLSKADLVLSPERLVDPDAGLFKIVSFDEFASLPIVDILSSRILFTANNLHMELSSDFRSVYFIISSTSVITDPRLRLDHSGDILRFLAGKAMEKGRRSSAARLPRAAILRRRLDE